MAHSCHLKVRGNHIDIYQHVNNAMYLTYMEDARWEMFEETGGLEWMTHNNYGFVVVNINIAFKAAAYMSDRIEVRTTFDPIVAGKRSGILHQSIYRGDTELASADIVYVCIDLAKERSLPFEGELLEKLNEWYQHYQPMQVTS